MRGALALLLLSFGAEASAQEVDGGVVEVEEVEAPAETAREIDALRVEVAELRARIEESAEEPAPAPPSTAAEDAELEAILGDVEAEAAQAEVERETLRLYGFMDVGLQRTWGSPVTTALAASDETTFVLGNLNLYVDATPIEGWRGLFEVRFTNLPHGHESAFETPFTEYERVDTAVIDSTAPGGGFSQVRTGAIIIERAHIDWTYSEALTIRAGVLLTPFGIWNVDHGTPTLISLTFPAYMILDFWPTRQVGIEALGVLHALPWAIGYHAYVTNGRTRALVDFSDGKLLGGRIFARTRRPLPMTIGISGFVGGGEDEVKRVADLGTGAIARDAVIEYDEQGLAADVSLDIGDLRLRAEAVFRQVFYEDGRRGPRFEQGPGVLLGDASDRRELGAYLLAAYRLPWAGLEPFVFVDYAQWPSPLGDVIFLPSAGLNVHFTPVTLLKLQYSYVTFFDLSDHDTERIGEPLHFAAARLVMAF
jgi:hypothetical protein